MAIFISSIIKAVKTSCWEVQAEESLHLCHFSTWPSSWPLKGKDFGLASSLICPMPSLFVMSFLRFNLQWNKSFVCINIHVYVLTEYFVFDLKNIEGEKGVVSESICVVKVVFYSHLVLYGLIMKSPEI